MLQVSAGLLTLCKRKRLDTKNGNAIASGSMDNTLKLWDLEGKLLQSFQGHFGDVSAIAFSPDGKFRAKMYNRNTDNSVNSGLENTNTTSAGFSLIHTQTFNNINELFSKKKKNQNPQDVSLNTE